MSKNSRIFHKKYAPGMCAYHTFSMHGDYNFRGLNRMKPQLGSPFRGDTETARGHEEWEELQRLAQTESDPQRLAVLIQRMCALLSEWHREFQAGNFAAIPELADT
jgi:hypothetical protein